jgi:hypothetical protein
VNKASSLALCVCALGVAAALTSTSWKRGPEPAQQLGTDEISPAFAAVRASNPAEKFELPGPSEAVFPETTTILLPSGSTREDTKGASQPNDSEPARLVRDLQRELKRVGCYAHDIDGLWTSATRKAMRDFADRVNAALPVVRPDPPQLVLLRSHAEVVCRETCRVGGGTDDRCLVSSPAAVESRKTEATTAGPLLLWTKSYVTPASPEPDPVEVVAPVQVAPRQDTAPRPRRHAGRPSGGGSLFFGIFGW